MSRRERSRLITGRARSTSVDVTLSRRKRRRHEDTDPPDVPPVREEASASISAATIRTIIVDALNDNRPQFGFRSTEWLHVSDLLNECVRKIALSQRLHQRILRSKLPPGTQIAFTTGTALADMVVAHFKKTMPDSLYGRWTCKCDYISFTGTYTEAMSADQCTRCLGDANVYNEIVVRNQYYKMTGSVDMVLLLHGKYVPVEIKSMANSYWEELQRPVPDHMMQSLFYWRLMRDTQRWRMASHTVVLYIAKQFLPLSTLPYKAFTVDVREELARLEPYFEEALELARYRASGTLPLNTCCPEISSPKAKVCQFQTQCFALVAAEQQR